MKTADTWTKEITMPSDVTFNPAITDSLGAGTKIRAGLRRLGERFMLGRELTALSRASLHIRDASIFAPRIAELRHFLKNS